MKLNIGCYSIIYFNNRYLLPTMRNENIERIGSYQGRYQIINPMWLWLYVFSKILYEHLT